MRIGAVTGWVFIGCAALVDVVQLVLDLFAIGTVVNRIIDIVVAMGMLAVMFFLFKASFAEESKLYLSLLATSIGEEIPIADVAPFWTLDAWYIVRSIRKRDKMLLENKNKEEETTQLLARQLEEEAYREQLASELRNRN